MAILGAVAGSLLGPAAPVLTSVLGSVAGTVAGSVAQGAAQAASGLIGGHAQAVGGMATGMQTVLGGIQEAFAKLFGQNQKYDHLHTCPQRPPVCGTGSIPANILRNPMQFLQGLQGILGQVGKFLQDTIGKFPGLMPGFPGIPNFGSGLPGLFGPGAGGSGGVGSPGAAFPGAGSPGGGTGSGKVGGGEFGHLDSMQNQIESLMQSENPSDQLKAQQLMNKFNRIFDSITTLLAKQRDVQSKVAQNMAR